MIAGKYRLLREIGSGAMGRVWAALNESTSREVALKLIIDRDEEIRLRLQREARACGALQHRNIVDVYDVAQTDGGDPVLVMQLLSGETLADLLVSRRRLGSPLAAAIGRDIACALAAMHGLGIVHRDVKPANIFLHRELDGRVPVVKVLDLGVSKNVAAKDNFRTALGGAVGTPLYMSPEQVQARPDVDPRADLWSLGVVLFEMLTGVRPFQGEFTDVILKIVRGEIPSVSRFVRQVDPALVSIVAGCLCRDRELRLGPAATIARLLDARVGPGDPWALPSPAAPLPDGPADATPTSRREPALPGVGPEVDQEAVTMRFERAMLPCALPRPIVAPAGSPIRPPPAPGVSRPERPAPAERGPAGPLPAPGIAAAASSPEDAPRPGSAPPSTAALRPIRNKKVLLLAAALLAVLGVGTALRLAMDSMPRPYPAPARAVLAGSKIMVAPALDVSSASLGRSDQVEPTRPPTPVASAPATPPPTPKPGSSARRPPDRPLAAPRPDCARPQFLAKRRCPSKNSSWP